MAPDHKAALGHGANPFVWPIPATDGPLAKFSSSSSLFRNLDPDTRFPVIRSDKGQSERRRRRRK